MKSGLCLTGVFRIFAFRDSEPLSVIRERRRRAPTTLPPLAAVRPQNSSSSSTSLFISGFQGSMAVGLRNSITIWILLLLIFQVEGRGYPVKVQSQREHHDCIDIYKEPAFHSPLQKNHSHQMWRSSISEGTAIRSSSHKSKPCPAGTVFIIRWKPSHPQTKIVWWKWYSRSIFIAYGRWEMMMFVIVPFGVFVGLFVLAFISLCLLRRYERRHRMYQTVPAPAPAPAPALGLERQEIEMFQISAYVAPKRESSEDDELCAICLEEYEAGQLLRTLTCTHKYHATCIDRWLSSNRTCPECRQRYPA